jgi:hypothetical protein
MKTRHVQSGQSLVMLLIFMIIALTITSAAIAMIVINTRTTGKFALGTVAYYAAESGAENAILRLLRNPNYSGETMAVGDGSAVITVSGVDPKTITSVGVVGDARRTIQVVAGYTNNILTVSSWKEI